MKVSVVIPTFNEERVIKACTESLSKQTFKDLEVVIVDDGSTDNTTNIVNEHCTVNPVFQLLKQNHKGPGEARNLGASKAVGEILVFVDADMTFDARFVEELVMPIINGKTKGTFSKNEFVSNWDNRWARCWNVQEGWSDQKRHPDDYPDMQKVFRAILKSEFNRIGGFSEGGHYTDDYLSEKLRYEAIVVRGAKFYHENPDNLSEIFYQAKWVGKRSYKLGLIGILYALFRSSLPVSIIVGLVKSITRFMPHFFVFKVVYDLGIFIGILEYSLFKKLGK